jgi:hypothetical protein
LDQYLKKQIGMKAGIENILNNQRAWRWIKEGGEYEDKPSGCISYWRSRNHFHNPIDNSGFSGLWDMDIFSSISAMSWVLQPVDSQGCGHYRFMAIRGILKELV